MDYTSNQQLAIDIRNANVLVSAAAGSGKTGVLTERIVRTIAGEGRDGKAVDPVDIDHLLVMTFTNAAAAEMRDRIRGSIEARIGKLRKKIKSGNADPDEERVRVLANLEKQSLLVHSAMITTIHGFCKSVIEEHFEEVSLDPDFRVADENECTLLMQDALEECLEAAYEEGDYAFLHAVECFSKAKNDAGIAELIIPIYRFVAANPDPEDFIRKCCGSYESESMDAFPDSEIMKQFCAYLLKELASAQRAIDAAITLIDQYPALEPYRSHIEAYQCVFGALTDGVNDEDISAFTERIRADIRTLSIPRLASIRSDKLNEDEKKAADQVKSLRDDAKGRIGKLSEVLAFDLATSYEHIRSVAPDLKALCNLVISFMHVYEEKKRSVNIIDFNDMEHLAVRILQNLDIAAVYRDHYEQIYVDEYQDSNMIQEMLVSLICRHDPGNVFCVGDVKQSIYRFRHARPDIFLSKYNSYSDGESPDRRILLNDNFRSRREVIDSVNEVFSQIMKAEIGGIEYDDSAMLSYGATFYDDNPCGETEEPSITEPKHNYRSEIVIGCPPEGIVQREMSGNEMIANIIATRISSMIRSGFIIYDKEKKIMRPLSFGDITILVRSVKQYESVFREVFASEGIPLAVTGHEGYFGTVEVQTSLAFLSAVDNPLCDIPLVTVARSPVGGFTDEDLARIVADTDRKKCIYEKMVAVAGYPDEKRGVVSENPDEQTETGTDTKTEISKLAIKCRAFLELLRKYREMATYTPVHGLLMHFIDNEYAHHVMCMSKGEQRMANLSMLLTKAEDFGRTSFKGLYAFVRYMDQIRRYEMDDGEAGIVSENDDVVRLMTMHASKGLEFPVCFVAGIEKGRNENDEYGKIIYNPTYGFGIDYTDLARRTTGTTLPKIVVSRMNRIEGIAEEMRLLYVAMTRARDKLIMVGYSTKDCFESAKANLEDCSSYLDMLSVAYSATGLTHMDISYVSEEELVTSRVQEEVVKNVATDEFLSVVREYEMNKGEEQVPHSGADKNETVCSDKGTADVADKTFKIGFTYPHHIDPELHAKLSVSELKHKAIEEEIARGLELVPDGQQLFSETDPDKYIPKFMRSAGETQKGGTFYGTAFHRIMELWDYSIDKDHIDSEDVVRFVSRMHDLHRMDQDQVDAIRTDDVAAFLNSALATNMKEASRRGNLYREQPFVIGVPESEIHEVQPDDMDEQETILVQGIIDAYYIEDDGITIVDYKTDRVSNDQMLIDRYRTQLEYYGRALNQIMGLPIKNLIIYSTHLRRIIQF